MSAIDSRTRLLDAAAHVFLEHGYERSSMDQVRAAASVSNGSLYHHFPTKGRLADALYAKVLRDFHMAVMPAIANDATAESGVKGLVKAHIDWVVRCPSPARLLHELRRGSGPVVDSVETDDVNKEAFARLSDWVHAHVAAGQMRELPFPAWIAVVFAPAISMTSHWVRQSPPKVSNPIRSALEHAAWMSVAP